jgi:hypothetical protein
VYDKALRDLQQLTDDKFTEVLGGLLQYYVQNVTSPEAPGPGTMLLSRQEVAANNRRLGSSRAPCAADAPAVAPAVAPDVAPAERLLLADAQTSGGLLLCVTAAARELLLENGLGGFTGDGREYIIILPPGRSTPLPWCNILANEGFGAVLSERGAAYTWAGNCHEFRLTPWRCDAVADLFAGSGTFALPLAEGASVHAVEGDAAASAALDAGWRQAQGLRVVSVEALRGKAPGGAGDLAPRDRAAYDRGAGPGPGPGAEHPLAPGRDRPARGGAGQGPRQHVGCRLERDLAHTYPRSCRGSRKR